MKLTPKTKDLLVSLLILAIIVAIAFFIVPLP